MLHDERRHVVGARHRIVHQRAGQQLAVVAVDDLLAERNPEPLGEAAQDLTVDDHRMQLPAAVVDDHVAHDGDTSRLHVDLHDRGVHTARPRHRGRRVEVRGPEPGASERDEALVAQRDARELGERDRA